MGAISALLKIIGGSASVSTMEPTSVISGLCSVASGTMEMKEVIEKFIEELDCFVGSGLQYMKNYYETGKDPRKIIPLLRTIKRALDQSGHENVYCSFETALKLYVEYKLK